jgi:sugar/nucleoside kinase (ribokinase family)
MAGDESGPVVCVSYLAAAALWTVPTFPRANGGAEIQAVEHSIAADAPMAAAVLAALNVPTLLLANDVGEDAEGLAAFGWLQRYQVATTVCMRPDRQTPHIVIVADEANTRTWFPYLPGVTDELGGVDLAPLSSASFAYVDCYQLIQQPAVRAIRATRTADVPLLLNLGGSPLSPSVEDAVRDLPGLVLQTNVDDDAYMAAPDVAASLLARTGASWVVITYGAYGAVAVSKTETVSAPGFAVTIRHTHCAGAAFSGGLLYGLRAGWPMADSLSLACASGALRCERAHDQPMPTLPELQAVITSHEHVSIPRTDPSRGAGLSA